MGLLRGDGLACSVQPSSYGCMWVVIMCEKVGVEKKGKIN